MSGMINWLLRPWRVRNLKNKYIKLHGFSITESEKVLARQLAALKIKQPGHAEEWYLEKIIYDLRKDRRR